MQNSDNSIDAMVVWSTMYNHPLCYYDEYYDAHMAVWNGVVMPRSYAMLIVSSNWAHLYPANSQKTAVLYELHRLINCGAMEPDIYKNLYSLSHYDVISWFKYKLCRDSTPAIWFGTMRDKYTTKQAFSWFKPEHERILTRTVTCD